VQLRIVTNDTLALGQLEQVENHVVRLTDV